MAASRPDEYKWRQRQLWSIGDYSAMASQFELAAQDLVHRLDIESGMRVLDIATGTGNAAIAAARAGADAVGLDLTPEMFDEAQWRAEELGVAVQWDEGDAEELPYPDYSFDRVASVFGLMFIQNADRAAAELVRVLRPGGRFALANWTLRGAVLDVFQAIGDSGLPQPVNPSRPLRWGDPDGVRDMFDGLDVELAFDWGSVSWVFEDAEDGVRWLEEVSGPVIGAKAALLAKGEWPARRAYLVQKVAQMTRPDIPGVWISADYLITLGRRLG